ncbi:MAG: hypothetical protein WCY32_02860 [Burkholderiaceae bacterium]
MAAKTASVSYADELAPEVLGRALASETVPPFAPHLTCLLDEAPVPIVVMTVEEAASHAHVPPRQVWRNVAKLAKTHVTPQLSDAAADLTADYTERLCDRVQQHESDMSRHGCPHSRLCLPRHFVATGDRSSGRIEAWRSPCEETPGTWRMGPWTLPANIPPRAERGAERALRKAKATDKQRQAQKRRR